VPYKDATELVDKTRAIIERMSPELAGMSLSRGRITI